LISNIALQCFGIEWRVLSIEEELQV
jgi:hypothetical protein